VHVLHGVVCHVWLCVCDVHCVYVHVVKEKALGICQVWKLIQSAYEIRRKVGAKD